MPQNDEQEPGSIPNPHLAGWQLTTPESSEAALDLLKNPQFSRLPKALENTLTLLQSAQLNNEQREQVASYLAQIKIFSRSPQILAIVNKFLDQDGHFQS